MIIKIILISLLGTILHFTYEISNHNKIVSIFSAVNESTWEHIKMALVATIIITIIPLNHYNNYFLGLFISLITLIILIPLIFYTYTYITNKPILIIDILSFYIVIIISQLLFYKITNMPELNSIYKLISIMGIIIVIFEILKNTYYPPKNFLFKDPITKKYGIEAHKCNKKV